MKAESNSPSGAVKAASDGLSLLAAAIEHERFVPHCLLTSANGLQYGGDDKAFFYHRSAASVLAPAQLNAMEAAAKSNAFGYLNGLLPFPRAPLTMNGNPLLAPHFLPKISESGSMADSSTMKSNETSIKIEINNSHSRSPDSTEFSHLANNGQSISNSNIDSTIQQISSQINDKSCSSSSNSKQYLRYKLLERQNRLNTMPPTSSQQQVVVNDKIADVKNRDQRSPKTGVFKTGRLSAFTPCSSTIGNAGTLSVKECLSTLSINVGCQVKTNVSPTKSASPTNHHQLKSAQTPPSVIVGNGQLPSSSSSSKSSASPPTTNPMSSVAAVSSSSPGAVSWSSDDYLPMQRVHAASRRNSSAAALAPAPKTATTSATVAAAAQQPAAKRRRTSEPSMDRRRSSSDGDDRGPTAVGGCASERYVERRRRNNEAAKRCRANRRALFDYRSRQSLELERENVSLRQTVKKLRQELQELRSLLSLRTSTNGQTIDSNGDVAAVKNLTANGHYEASVENTSSEDETPLDFSTKKLQIR